ncbi:MAG: hypothetical protein KKF67_01920, partial [Nanoarchaeota archaeon]|nr:hypothetical protein [Nanoarchaeota archaeon]
MMWQDIAITICIVAFSYALIPQIYKGFREKKGLISLQTSFITFTGLYLLSLVYFTLKLYFSTIISIITGTLWLILF